MLKHIIHSLLFRHFNRSSFLQSPSSLELWSPLLLPILSAILVAAEGQRAPKKSTFIWKRKTKWWFLHSTFSTSSFALLLLSCSWLSYTLFSTCTSTVVGCFRNFQISKTTKIHFFIYLFARLGRLETNDTGSVDVVSSGYTQHANGTCILLPAFCGRVQEYRTKLT